MVGEGDIEKGAKERGKTKQNRDDTEAKRISVIKPWATVTSGSSMMVVLVSYYLRGRTCHPAFLHYSASTAQPALFTDAAVQLGGLLFPRFAPLSSPCHSKDLEITLRKAFCENSTLVCNFQTSGLCEWAKGGLAAP